MKRGPLLVRIKPIVTNVVGSWRVLAVAASVSWVSCSHLGTQQHVVLTQTAGQTGASRESVGTSDAAILAFAERQAASFKGSMEGSRKVREVSDSVVLGLTTATAANEAFQFGEKTIAWLGVGSRGIPEGQKIINAKGRSLAYRDAAGLIDEAVADYLERWKDPGNPNADEPPPKGYLTPNGVILYQRVMASDYAVQRALAGRLVSPGDMNLTAQEMTVAGTAKIQAGVRRDPSTHVITRDGPNSWDDRKAAAAAATERPIQNDPPPGVEDAGDFDDKERPMLIQFNADVKRWASSPKITPDQREQVFASLLKIAAKGDSSVAGAPPEAASVIEAYDRIRDSGRRTLMREELSEWGVRLGAP